MLLHIDQSENEWNENIMSFLFTVLSFVEEKYFCVVKGVYFFPHASNNYKKYRLKMMRNNINANVFLTNVELKRCQNSENHKQ